MKQLKQISACRTGSNNVNSASRPTPTGVILIGGLEKQTTASTTLKIRSTAPTPPPRARRRSTLTPSRLPFSSEPLDCRSDQSSSSRFFHPRPRPRFFSRDGCVHRTCSTVGNIRSYRPTRAAVRNTRCVLRTAELRRYMTHMWEAWGAYLCVLPQHCK